MLTVEKSICAILTYAEENHEDSFDVLFLIILYFELESNQDPAHSKETEN